MTTRDRERPGESDHRTFERLLLDSARADGVSDAAVRNAWSEFAVVSAATASSTPAASRPRARTRWRAGVKGWIVGALCGSAITAAWTGAWRPASLMRTPVSQAPREAADLAPRPPSRAVDQAATSASAPPVDVASRLPASPRISSQRFTRPLNQVAVAVSRRPAPLGSKENAANQFERADAPGLAAEVAALDRVRSAIAARTYLRALRLVDDYHAAFPAGQLAPDADALAIEVYAAQGDRAEAVVRAARFLERYPNTPHAAHIAALTEHEPR